MLDSTKWVFTFWNRCINNTALLHSLQGNEWKQTVADNVFPTGKLERKKHIWQLAAYITLITFYFLLLQYLIVKHSEYFIFGAQQIFLSARIISNWASEAPIMFKMLHLLFFVLTGSLNRVEWIMFVRVHCAQCTWGRWRVFNDFCTVEQLVFRPKSEKVQDHCYRKPYSAGSREFSKKDLSGSQLTIGSATANQW